jgi:hypothetical protein
MDEDGNFLDDEDTLTLEGEVSLAVCSLWVFQH